MSLEAFPYEVKRHARRHSRVQQSSSRLALKCISIAQVIKIVLFNAKEIKITCFLKRQRAEFKSECNFPLSDQVFFSYLSFCER